jgi:hypothetical protein
MLPARARRGGYLVMVEGEAGSYPEIWKLTEW